VATRGIGALVLRIMRSGHFRSEEIRIAGQGASIVALAAGNFRCEAFNEASHVEASAGIRLLSSIWRGRDGSRRHAAFDQVLGVDVQTIRATSRQSAPSASASRMRMQVMACLKS
jgi:hypothetical protein